MQTAALCTGAHYTLTGKPVLWSLPAAPHLPMTTSWAVCWLSPPPPPSAGGHVQHQTGPECQTPGGSSSSSKSGTLLPRSTMKLHRHRADACNPTGLHSKMRVDVYIKHTYATNTAMAPSGGMHCTPGSITQCSVSRPAECMTWQQWLAI